MVSSLIQGDERRRRGLGAGDCGDIERERKAFLASCSPPIGRGCPLPGINPAAAPATSQPGQQPLSPFSAGTLPAGPMPVREANADRGGVLRCASSYGMPPHAGMPPTSDFGGRLGSSYGAPGPQGLGSGARLARNASLPGLPFLPEAGVPSAMPSTGGPSSSCCLPHERSGGPGNLSPPSKSMPWEAPWQPNVVAPTPERGVVEQLPWEAPWQPGASSAVSKGMGPAIVSAGGAGDMLGPSLRAGRQEDLLLGSRGTLPPGCGPGGAGPSGLAMRGVSGPVGSGDGGARREEPHEEPPPQQQSCPGYPESEGSSRTHSPIPGVGPPSAQTLERAAANAAAKGAAANAAAAPSASSAPARLPPQVSVPTRSNWYSTATENSNPLGLRPFQRPMNEPVPQPVRLFTEARPLNDVVPPRSPPRRKGLCASCPQLPGVERGGRGGQRHGSDGIGGLSQCDPTPRPPAPEAVPIPPIPPTPAKHRASAALPTPSAATQAQAAQVLQSCMGLPPVQSQCLAPSLPGQQNWHQQQGGEEAVWQMAATMAAGMLRNRLSGF